MPNDKCPSFWQSQGSKASGAFILTASHNPGGPDEVYFFLLCYTMSHYSLVVYPFHFQISFTIPLKYESDGGGQ